MKNRFQILITLLIFSNLIYSQTSTNFKVPLSSKVNLKYAEDKWKVTVKSLEDIYEGNKTYAKLFKEHKQKTESLYKRKDYNPLKIKEKSKEIIADTFLILKNFQGNAWGGGTPNDNSLAISNGNILLSAVNSSLNIYDINADSMLKSIPMTVFSQGIDSISSNQYDPKMIYDPQEDRFITVFLAGTNSSQTHIIIGFSETNNPLDNWNMYKINGNPFSDTSWFDYPAIALTKGELFLTGNLLKNGGSWQTSFKQSIIFQIDKKTGYQGLPLNLKLWSDIKFKNKPLRNIQPVQGGDSLLGPDIYLLNNFNFATQNDSIFLIHISDSIGNSSAQLTVKPVISDIAYGMPPDARQTTGNKLATNDARVLGAFLQNNKIQFVNNTIDTNWGSAGVFHGIISNYSDNNPTCHANIISDSLLDYGYPNISFSGKNENEDQAIITFDYTGPSLNYPGVCGLFFRGNDGYSKIVKIKKGTAYISLISGTDRWGDYTGTQRKYNEPGKVWISGTFGYSASMYKPNGTWIAELYNYYETPLPIIPLVPEFKVFPNPSSGRAYIEFPLEENQQILIQIFDIQGNYTDKLTTTNASKGNNLLSFSTSHLRKGIYIIRVLTLEDKELFSTKIVVN